MSAAKAKGTFVESALVLHAKAMGFPDAERIPLAGAADRGDVRLSRSPLVVAECKWANRGIQLKPWTRELEREVGNAGAQWGLLVCKQAGAGIKSVGSWFSAVPAATWEELSALDESGSLRLTGEGIGCREVNGYATSLIGAGNPLSCSSPRLARIIGGGEVVVSSLDRALSLFRLSLGVPGYSSLGAVLI